MITFYLDDYNKTGMPIKAGVKTSMNTINQPQDVHICI